MKQTHLAMLLAFNGGFVDTTGFLGLDGLFTAHVTGNFVTLGAALVLGSHGVIAKIAALPEFMAVLALTHLAGAALARRGLPALRLLLGAKVLLLAAFFGLAVTLAPFPHSDTPPALLTGFAGVAAMAVQNAVQRAHLASVPPTAQMTGNTTQIVLDLVDLARRDGDGKRRAEVLARVSRTGRVILTFAAGCAIAAMLYAAVGFWGLALPVAVGTASAALRLAD